MSKKKTVPNFLTLIEIFIHKPKVLCDRECGKKVKRMKKIKKENVFYLGTFSFSFSENISNPGLGLARQQILAIKLVSIFIF